MAVPTIESTTLSEIGDSSTTFTIDMPSTRPDDDLYVCILFKDDDPEVTLPGAASHWNEIVSIEENSAIRMMAWWWIGNSEPTSYTVSQDSETDAAVVYRISGYDTSAPINPINGYNTNQGAGSNQSAPALTVTSGSTLVLRAIGVDGNIEVTATPPTEDYSGLASGGSGRVGYGFSHEDGPDQDTSTGTAQFTHNSDDYISLTLAIEGSSDAIAPILTSPRVYNISSTGSFLEVVTDEGNGTIYWTVSTGSNLTATQVKAGEQVANGNQSVSTAGTQSLGAATGLSQKTDYWFTAVQDDAASNESNVVSESFTTAKNFLIFDSWNTILENNLLYWNDIFTQNANTVNTAVFQGVSPDLPSTTLIDSIQYVDIVMGTGTTGTQTFNAVNRSRSIILCHGNWIGAHIQSDTNSDPETVLCRKEFTADNEITITRGTADAGNTFTVRVQVIEFAEGVIEAIHTGSHTITGTNASSTSETIDTDTDSDNWIVINNGHEFGDATSSGRHGFAIVRWVLTESAGNISVQATRGDNSVSHNTICQYTAFRFVDGIIDSKQVVSITNNSGTTGSASITSVDRTRSTIWQAGHTVATTDAGYDQFQHFQKFRFVSNSSIESNIFSNPEEPATINLQVIEFSNGYINSIQSGSTTFDTSQTFASQSISEVDITKTILFVDGAISDEGGVTPHDPEYSYFAGRIQPNGGAIVFSRGTTAGSNPLIVGWRVVEFI